MLRLFDVTRHPIYQIDCVARQNENGKAGLNLTRRGNLSEFCKNGLRHLFLSEKSVKTKFRIDLEYLWYQFGLDDLPNSTEFYLSLFPFQNYLKISFFVKMI
jgi:hypothetical protein